MKRKAVSWILVLTMVFTTLFGSTAMTFAETPAESESQVAVEADAVIDTEAELDAAVSAGGEVTLGGNIEVSDTVKIPAGVTVKLDLAGYKISMNQTETATANSELIENNGDLTIVDSGSNGTVEYKYSGSDVSYSLSTISNGPGAKLTVKGGTITNTSESQNLNNFAIDNLTNGTAGTATVIIENGVINCDTFRSIRQFANSATDLNYVKIVNGTINGQVWLQSPSANQNKAELVIEGGSFKPMGRDGSSVYITTASSKSVDVSVSGGYFATKIGVDNASNVGKVITGGTFSEAAVSGTNAALLGEGLVFGKDGTVGEPVYVAAIGSDKFVSLQEAFDVATAGDTVTVLENIEDMAVTTVAKDKEIVLDLNGKTLTGVDNTSKNYGLIQNNGTLTIKDSVGGGKITVSATINSGWNRYSAVISNNPGGTLTVESGTIEHLGGTDMAYGIDSLTNGGIGDVSVTINGGTIKSTYRGIRQFLNSDSKENTLVINGGTVEGPNRAVFFHDPSAKANKGTLTIGENAAINGSVYLYVTAGSTEWPVDVTIAKAALGENDVVTANVPKGYELTDNNGTYAVELVKVAKVGDTKYTSLQAAIDAAEAGDTVTVISDIELKEGITVAAGKEIVLDLNGKTISQSKACTAHYEMIKNNGSLTIKGDGKISFKDTGAGDSSFGWGSYTIGNYGTLVVENGTVENLTELNTDEVAVHMYCAIHQGSGSTTINGGTISNPTYRSIRINKGSLEINGGTMDGQVWMHPFADGTSLTITGGSFGPNGVDGSSVYVENSSKKVTLKVTGGNFETKIGCAKPADLAGSISGGKFSEKAVSGTNAALLADGYTFDRHGNVVTEESLELKGNGTLLNPYKISTVDELVYFRDSVNAGETKYNADDVRIKLTADIDLAGEDWSVNIGDDCNATFDGIFDGNGHTISNLNSTETAAKGDGYVCTGLFGAIGGNAVIKDLTIENVNIDAGGFTGNNVGAVVGFAYNCKGSIENVTVKGDINIDAENVTGTGVIVGYDYGWSGGLTIENCTVEGNDGSAVTGAAYVGGIVGYGSPTTVVTGCTVNNLDITGTSCAAGGIAGIVVEGGSVNGNTVKNVDLTAEHANWLNSAGIVAGCITGKSITVTDTVYENVTANGEATDTIVGSEHKNKPTAPVSAVQANIGDVYYVSLEDAMNAAENGDTVNVLADAAITGTLTVDEGEEIVLNLNGNTVTGTPAEAKVYEVIKNNGTLTITGNGTVVCDHKLTGSTGYAVNTITNTGSLTIDGATIENNSTSSNQIGYAIDNNSTSKDATLVIKDGTVKVSGSNYYDGIRQFCNSVDKNNSVTVKGGNVSSIWLQNPSDGTDKNTKDVKGSVTISGGTVGALYLEPSAGFTAEISGGEIGIVSAFQTAEGRDPAEFITGGTFTEKPADSYIAAGYEVVSEGNKYVVAKDVEAPSIDGVTDGAIYKPGTIVIYDVVENNLASVTVNGEEVTSFGKLKTPGEYTIVAKDEAGNTTTVTIKIEAEHVFNNEWYSNSAEHWYVCECGETSGREAHNWGEYTVRTEPTCDASGLKVRECSVCGKTETDSIAPLGHSYSSSYTVDVKATTSADGSKSKHCTRSGCNAKTSVTTIYAASKVSLSTSKLTYTGSSQAPTLTVKDSKGNTISSSNYTVSGLTKKTSVGRYSVKVTFKGDYSGTKTMYYTIVPKAPTSATAVLYGHDDVKFSWSACTGASGYNVYYKKSSSSEWIYLDRTTNTYMKKINLNDGIKYDFKVVPYYYTNGTRYVSTSYKSASCYTLKQVNTPTVSTSGSSVKVKWSNIDGESGYQISRSTSKTGTNIVATYNTTSGTYKTVSATKGTGYYYKVRAYKTVDGVKVYGPWSNTKYYKR